MKNKPISIDYVNGLMFELEKAFWDERGLGARFRTTTIGKQYLSEKIFPLLKSNEIEQIVEKIEEVLADDGILANVSYSTEDRLIRILVEGCIHRQVEERMMAKEIEPFTCVPANIIALAIEEKLDIPVELAEIKVEEGGCRLMFVLFEKRPVLE